MANPAVTQLKGVINDIENDYKELDVVRQYLHRCQMHPWYEYKTTTGPRKCWDDQNKPPEGDGWTRNCHHSEGWERFDFHEESYWRRIKPQEP